jgi:hypothetical protein
MKELCKEAKTKLQIPKIDQMKNSIPSRRESSLRDYSQNRSSSAPQAALQRQESSSSNSGRGSENNEEIAIKEEVLNDQKIEDLRFD